MKPSEYEFKIGDKVVTVYGEVGHIVDICTCEECAKRGFFEPFWVEDGGFLRRYISINTANYNFFEYRQIGKYHFDHPFSKGMITREIKHLEKELKKYKKRLSVIEELEKEVINGE